MDNEESLEEEEEEDLEESDDSQDRDYVTTSNVSIAKSKLPRSTKPLRKGLPIDAVTKPNGDKLPSQLIALNLKLFQDNFRLKKFCNNFKLYLEKYCESDQREKSSENCAEEIYCKYEQNYGNIQWQLFNDYTGIKALVGE